ncbi:FAD-binding oxidoreductase [Massilia sp. HP4]|uniref:FAD-binding oxidoreductase n=1 Tax=Massilia sp. HP4 TaxID=2562316 RepID=UPI0010C0AFF3|nr:FAD-binding oxidoreductase [Massilia sp. HP4]
MPARRRLALALASLGLPALARQPLVNDASGLNPVSVDRILAPRTVDEIVAALRAHPGPVSIGGARYSMGGQIASAKSLHLDMRGFDRVLRFVPRERSITVQPGITWRRIQAVIDPHDLALQIMQSYADFSVGGSLGVNAHGRYVGQGPLVSSVQAIRLVLADGSLVDASPTRNSELFYGAIGGYGGIGVIVEATLRLADNTPLERRSQIMPLSVYRHFFATRIGSDPNAIMHNATLYPDDYRLVRAVTFSRSRRAVTLPSRLAATGGDYRTERLLREVATQWSLGKAMRRRIFEPLFYSLDAVEWRNHQAGLDIQSLAPLASAGSIYALQEYFVPVDAMERFADGLRTVLRRHRVNVINVSIRHAHKDPGTLLAWARTDVFAFVLYYHQQIAQRDRDAVRAWTRELIDAATVLGGAYYLPYQIVATPAQFHAAYPGAGRFFALKRRVDPTNRFRNKLWDAYYTP